jgi:hypothetical protein
MREIALDFKKNLAGRVCFNAVQTEHKQGSYKEASVCEEVFSAQAQIRDDLEPLPSLLTRTTDDSYSSAAVADGGGWAASAAMFTPTDCSCGTLYRILLTFCDFIMMDKAKTRQTIPSYCDETSSRTSTTTRCTKEHYCMRDEHLIIQDRLKHENYNSRDEYYNGLGSIDRSL